MPSPKKELPKMAICRRVMLKSRSDHPELSRVDEALARLNHERVRQELNHGAVETIIVLNGHQKVNCYGRYLDARFIFGNFNLNCTTRGVRTTCQISYPRHPAVSPSHHQGFFVRASELGITANANDPEEDFYLAVVNICPAGDCDFSIIPYNLRNED